MKRKLRPPESSISRTNKNAYNVRSISYYEQSTNIRMQEPVSIGCYSKLQDGSIEYNKKALYPTPMQSKQVKTNLLEGFIESDATEDTSKHPAPLDPLLQAIHESKWSGVCNVISFRNNFNKIFGTIYNPMKEWQFTLCKQKNCMIFDVERTEDDKNYIPGLYQQQCAYAGRKFEQEVTSQPAEEEFCTIQQTQLGQMKLIIAAEIDGYHPTTKAMVELKTFRALEGKKDQYTFERYKLLAFWIQSYLAGVPHICCGFRDKQFNVVKTQWFKTHDLPNFGKQYWNPQGCLAFGNDVLQWLQQQTHDQGFYRVHYQTATMKIELTPLTVSPPVHDVSFLKHE